MPDLLAVPSPHTSDRVVDLADWVEISTFFKRDYSVSREDLATALERAHGMSRSKGKGRQDALDFAGDVFNELEDRIQTCHDNEAKSEIGAYPFYLNDVQTTLHVKKEFLPRGNFGLVYRFLLFVSRGDMSSQARVLGGIDPTQVFERLCADVLLNYWGGKAKHCGSLVFGTAKVKKKKKGANSFESNINNLCSELGEGIGMKPGVNLPGAGDAKLDIAVWRKFADDRAGRLVGFAQCKTGIHWKEHLSKLQPRSFCGRFMREPLVVDPVRLYLVPFRIEKTRWADHSREAGILFDRCRIAQYSNTIGKEILRDCRSWIASVVPESQKRKTK
jgi:hypothetical protein